MALVLVKDGAKRSMIALERAIGFCKSGKRLKEKSWYPNLA